MQPGPAMLVRGHPAVDEIVVFDRARGWRAFLDVRRALAQPFDVVLDLQVYFKAGVITGLAHAPVKLGFDRARAHDLNWLFTNRKIPPHALQHVQDQYFEFLAALGVPARAGDLGPRPLARTSARTSGSSSRASTGRSRALVIGSSKPQKDWLPERWAELADALHRDFGLQPVLAGGRSPRELATEQAILGAAKVPVVSALGSGLRNLVGILDASALVVSLDTGPLHMTVALDRPVITLIGYSNPKRVGPYRKFHDLHRGRVRRSRRGLSRLDGEPARPDAADHGARCARAGGALARALRRLEPPEVVAHADAPEQREHPSDREPHHREVVAVDPLDDRGAVALDAVRARLVHRLARGDVGADRRPRRAGGR